MKKKFIEFLKDNLVYKAYVYNVKNQSTGVPLDELELHEFLSGAFIWENSPEGRRFWKNIEKRWYAVLYDPNM